MSVSEVLSTSKRVLASSFVSALPVLSQEKFDTNLSSLASFVFPMCEMMPLVNEEPSLAKISKLREVFPSPNQKVAFEVLEIP